MTVSAPPPPPSGPSDWADAVNGNAYSNIQRLGLWVGGDVSVPSGQAPTKYFSSVAPGSIGGGANPPVIYVVAHGWAPGYRAAVERAKGALLWWSAEAVSASQLQSSSGASQRWASDWAWSPVSAPGLAICETGMMQEIYNFDPHAVILAYSWIDDSATDPLDLEHPTDLTEVYRSEAYTHTNGLRLADALFAAIDPAFWSKSRPRLRLIGHSHGSRVVTVAALTLQQRGLPVSKLSILDSPESETTLAGNGSNLLGFYLRQLLLAPKSRTGVFVDNYVSYFGECYSLDPALASVVDVALQPSELFTCTIDPGDCHTYAAAWYAGAAAGGQSEDEGPLGLAWLSPPANHSPALNQNWPTGVDEANQWFLEAGDPIQYASSYVTTPLTVSPVSQQGSVSGDPSSQLVFGSSSGAPGGYSIFQGSYVNWTGGDGYGLALDIAWTGAQPGDYFVVVMDSPAEYEPETLLVIDGASAPPTYTSVAICSFASTLSSFLPLTLSIYFYATGATSKSQIRIANFRLVQVYSDEAQSLRSRRVARATARHVALAVK